MKRRWENEKASIARIREIKEKIETARSEAERAEKESALQRAASRRWYLICLEHRRLQEVFGVGADESRMNYAGWLTSLNDSSL